MMTMRKWRHPGARTVRAAALATLAVLAACADDGPTTPASRPPVPAVARVEVAAERTELLVGHTAQLRATVFAANGAALTGRAVEWSSSDGAVVRVGAGGSITAAGAGTATVTATSEGRAGSVRLRVSWPEIAEVRVAPVDTVLEVGEARVLSAVALAADGTAIPGLPVRWISSDSTAVRVDSTGRATALREGIQVINAEVGGRMGWARLVVPPDVRGEWALTIYELEGGGTRCYVRGMVLRFSRDGMSLSGEARPGEQGHQSGCDIIGGPPPYSTPMPPNGPFAGTLRPAVAVAKLEVDLRFEWDAWQLTGTLGNGVAGGDATLTETVQGRTVVRRGRWHAARM